MHFGEGENGSLENGICAVGSIDAKVNIGRPGPFVGLLQVVCSFECEVLLVVWEGGNLVERDAKALETESCGFDKAFVSYE